jgi:galactokinase
MIKESMSDAGSLYANEWLSRLTESRHDVFLQNIYGSDQQVLAERKKLLHQAILAFLVRFGDLPVRIFRAPGRLNLRGMHVDTHGGWMNLMTHQREVVMVAAASASSHCTLVNCLSGYNQTEWDLADQSRFIRSDASWLQTVTADSFTPGTADWSRYCLGAALRLQHQFPAKGLTGVTAMVASDLPVGASLSSSTALNLVSLMAFAAFNGLSLSLPHLLLASRDVEWYAGARSGLSDQAAILAGQRDQIFHVAIDPDDPDVHAGKYIPFPDDLSLLVVNSCTTRMLSGAERVQYSLNRFAYSMALNVLQAELFRAGYPAEKVSRMHRLSEVTPEALGGMSALMNLLQSIPETISLSDLKKRYAPDNLERDYALYFDGVPEKEKPDQIPLRGPLLFGIAESARAQRFPLVLQEKNYALAGRLMSLGHAGDRVASKEGNPFKANVRDTALKNQAAHALPVELIPGWYGASSPALDMLVDAAIDGGAFGASLTGAGIAGAVLALCSRSKEEQVRQAILQCMQSRRYANVSGGDDVLRSTPVQEWVVANHAVSGAGEILLPF